MECSRIAALRTKCLSRMPLFLLFLIVVLPLSSEGAQLPVKESKNSSGSASTLMLVREWNADNGILTGWLPTHYAAIQLELLSKASTPQFELDEAVYLVWPRMRNHESEDVHLRVSPPTRSFEGESWLPVRRDPNLVRIGKSLYLVRGIILNGAKWRFASKSSTAGREPATEEARR